MSTVSAGGFLTLPDHQEVSYCFYILLNRHMNIYLCISLFTKTKELHRFDAEIGPGASVWVVEIRAVAFTRADSCASRWQVPTG